MHHMIQYEAIKGLTSAVESWLLRGNKHKFVRLFVCNLKEKVISTNLYIYYMYIFIY